jgi:hypothetical protein
MQFIISNPLVPFFTLVMIINSILMLNLKKYDQCWILLAKETFFVDRWVYGWPQTAFFWIIIFDSWNSFSKNNPISSNLIRNPKKGREIGYKLKFREPILVFIYSSKRNSSCYFFILFFVIFLFFFYLFFPFENKNWPKLL